MRLLKVFSHTRSTSLVEVFVEIPIDKSIQPVQQAYRRAPIALEGKIYEKLKYLLEMDIIEKVDGPSPWISPVVPIVKSSGDLRLCVDMRQANQAVRRETHPLPVIDELLGSVEARSEVFKTGRKGGVSPTGNFRRLTCHYTLYHEVWSIQVKQVILEEQQ